MISSRRRGKEQKQPSFHNALKSPKNLLKIRLKIKKLCIETKMARWRLCIINFTNSDKLLNFIEDKILQNCDFLKRIIADAVKNHEMRSVYFK